MRSYGPALIPAVLHPTALHQPRRTPLVRYVDTMSRAIGVAFEREKPLERVSFHAAVAAIFITLAACSPPPPIVSADTSCERFAHISATDAQIKVFQNNWDTMEAYADQVVAHNVEYDKSCLGPVKP